MKPPQPRLELIGTATFTVGPIEIVGRTHAGERRFVRILSGKVEGKLNGEVLPGGVDYQLIGDDGVARLDARYVIRTAEGVSILIRNRGIRHGVIGDDPSTYYFRSTPSFETGDERYAWLTKIVALGSGARGADYVMVDFYAVF